MLCLDLKYNNKFITLQELNSKQKSWINFLNKKENELIWEIINGGIMLFLVL